MSQCNLQSRWLLLQPLPIPSFPTKLPSFPEFKEVPAWDQSKHKQCWAVGLCYLRGWIKANTNSAGQWVCATLEDDRVLEWWREFQWLFQCPSDSPIQRLTCQQAMTFWLPTTQQKKDDWWTAPPCLQILGQRDYHPLKDFHRTCDYQEVRKEEMIVLSMALWRSIVWLGMPLEYSVVWCRGSTSVLSFSLREATS